MTTFDIFILLPVGLLLWVIVIGLAAAVYEDYKNRKLK